MSVVEERIKITKVEVRFELTTEDYSHARTAKKADVLMC
jgi:hypothetical protein